MAYSYGGLEREGSPFYIILEREAQEAKANRHETYMWTYREVVETQCQTIFLFVLSLYTKFAYFINNLIGQGPHVIEDVEKGKVQALKKYCKVALAAYQSFNREKVELMKCMDLFLMNDLTRPIPAIPQNMLTRIVRLSTGLQPSTIIKSDMFASVELLKEDLIKMMKMNLELELENLTTTEKLDKISRNVGPIQRSVVNTIEMITHEMYKVLEYGNHLKKSSCFNDYLHHHKLEGSFTFILTPITRPLPKLWMCNKCWQWNKNELLYTNTQSAACEHCGQPIIPDTIGKFNNPHEQCSINMVNW